MTTTRTAAKSTSTTTCESFLTCPVCGYTMLPAQRVEWTTLCRPCSGKYGYLATPCSGAVTA